MDVSRLGYLLVYAICRQLLHAQAKCRAVMNLWLMAHFLTAKFTPTRLCPLLPLHTQTHTSHQSGVHLLKVGLVWQNLRILRDYIVNDQFHLKSSRTVSLSILVAGCSFNMKP